MHEDKKVFEIKVQGLGTLQLFVDQEESCAWFQITDRNSDFDSIGWAAVKVKDGKIEYIAVNNVPLNAF